MKARHIIHSAIFVLALALGIMFIFALKKHNSEIAKRKLIPDITLNTIFGETFSLAEISPESKTAILFFSTDCEFCRKEIEGIIANRDSFDNINWVFVSISPQEEIEKFLYEYPLNSIPKARICFEEYPELFIALNVTAPPSIFVYNSNGELEHCQLGAVSIKTILQWLK